MKRLLVLIAAALVLGLVGGSIAFGQEDEEVSADDVVAEVASITVAEAEALGYAEETPCVDASELPAEALEQLDIPATAGMGIHYINMSLVDATLDPLEPEAIQFGPDGEVWNVEYLTPPQDEPQEIFGQTLTYVEEVDLDALHLWVIDNPNGRFADFNPDVDCGTPVTELASTGTGGILTPGDGNGTLTWLIALAAIAGAALTTAGWTLRRRAGR